jgi:predicted  nucleic acid-binding Zn-ribbon protein
MCPLCGLHHSIKKYSPEDLPLDIEAVLKVGLGRGRGTKVVSRYSLLGDDDVSPKIVKRVLTLCRFFLSQNIVTLDDLKHSLGIRDAPSSGTVSVKEYNKLKEDIESLKVMAEMEKRRGDMEFSRANRLSETVNSQRGKVNDYNRLREEYEALKVEAEVERRRADNAQSKANDLQVKVNSLQDKVSNLQTRISNAESSRSSLVKELDEMETSIENANEILDDVIEDIEDRTDFVFDHSEESREEFIAGVVSRLFEDVEALKAENEE